MELLIVFNILLLLFLIGTYLSLSGRVKHLEEAVRRHFRETKGPAAGISGSGGPAAEGGVAENAVEEKAVAENAVAVNEAAVNEGTAIEENAATALPPENVPPPAGVPVQAEPVQTEPVHAEPATGPSRISSMFRPRTREEWEILIGGKLLNRVGALALILGVGFFLKYAFDNDWLNETARVLLGGVAGLLLIGSGHRFHRCRLGVFAQGLTGAGAAILYLSIYAAYDFYHLIPQPVAFLLMALVTAAALLLSLYYDARAIALLGWAGGFLTPFLLVTADLNTFGLFVYITLLDVGLIAVLLKRRRWRLLEPLGIAATYGTYLTWSFRADLPDGFGTALAFLILWWAMFAGLNLNRSVVGDQGRRLWRWAAVTINAVGLYVMLMRLSLYTEGFWSFLGIQFLSPQSASVYFQGVVSAVFALVFFALTAWTLRRTDDSSAPAIYATGAILLAVRVPMSFFNGIGVIIVWGLEALAVFWFGAHFGRRAVRHAGTALLAFSFVMIFLMGGTHVSNLVSTYAPVLSLRTGAYLVAGGSLLACAGMLRNRIETRDQTDLRRDHLLSTIFHLAWTFLFLVWGTVEVLNYFQYHIVTMESGSPEQLQNLRQLAVSGVWLICALLVMIMGKWMDIRALRAAAIVYFGCTVVKVFIFDLMFLDTLYRIVAFLGLSFILIAVSYLYYRNRPAS